MNFPKFIAALKTTHIHNEKGKFIDIQIRVVARVKLIPLVVVAMKYGYR